MVSSTYSKSIFDASARDALLPSIAARRELSCENWRSCFPYLLAVKILFRCTNRTIIVIVAEIPPRLFHPVSGFSPHVFQRFSLANITTYDTL
jgi:hypothetical protein